MEIILDEAALGGGGVLYISHVYILIFVADIGDLLCKALGILC